MYKNRPSLYLTDARLYDAYVVYQMQKMDKVTENTLCQFITQVLPSVLEEKCGYRLFIQGRDDIPGEGMNFISYFLFVF